MKSNICDKCLYRNGLEEKRSRWFGKLTGIISQMDSRSQKLLEESVLRHEVMRSSVKKRLVKERREVVRRKALKLTKMSGSAASLCDRDGHAEMLQNMVLSQTDAASLVTLTTAEEERYSTVRGTIGGQIEQYHVLTVSSELEMRKIREEKGPPGMALNKYRVRMMNLKKKM